jgi:prefoldin alpha subunit
VRSIETAFPKSSITATKPKEVLVPLTESLYVTGTIGAPPDGVDDDSDIEEKQDTVLVDIGTGFYVEKTKEQAIKFYEARVKDVGEKVGEVEDAIRGKSDMARVLEEGMSST